MINESDLFLGAKLICVATWDGAFYKGEAYEIIDVIDEDEHPYRIRFGGDFIAHCHISDIVSYNLVPETKFTKKELFTMKMTGKVPERYLE